MADAVDDSTSDGTDVEEEESVDSFLRAAARVPGDSGTGALGVRVGMLGLRESLLVAKRYRLERRLGEGGMGIVWAATHTITRKSFALKFLKSSLEPNDESRRRFIREARVAATIDHPNVVGVLDVFELENGTPVMVMDLLSGETLGQRLARERALSLAQTAAIVLPVVSAVGTAHALGIVHRDLKPENIFLTDETSAGAVKVLDFGVAKLGESAKSAGESELSTGTGALLGTAAYMAPEQALAERDVDHRADVWALGVILYECLAGTRPLKGTTVGQVVAQMLGDGIEPLAEVAPDLPRDVTDLVSSMLSRTRSARPRSLRTVADVLARYASVAVPSFAEPRESPKAERDEPVDSGGAGALEIHTAHDRTRTRWAWVILVAVLCLAGIALLRGRDRETPTATAAPVTSPPMPPGSASAFAESRAARNPQIALTSRPALLRAQAPASSPSILQSEPATRHEPPRGHVQTSTLHARSATSVESASSSAPLAASASAQTPARRGLAGDVPF
jgi:serine/threonine protein kinase